MRAAVLRGGIVQARETDDPVPGPGQVLVRSLACGICASDIHFMDHPEGDADDDSGLSRYDADADIVMGHEFCAEVVDYGPKTRRRWATGTRVSSIPALAVRDGVRIIGQSPEAPGGFGEYFLLTEAMAQVVPTDLPSELVSIADAITVGWSYATRAAVTAGEVPLVIGCGAIGLSAVASLRRLGAGPIVAVDFVASRRETAKAMGADVVIDPAELSPYEAWRDLAYGSPEPVRDMMGLLDLPGCVVFECVGVPGVLDSIIRGCERGTRIFSAGGPPQGDRLHTMVAKRKGLNVQFGGGPSMTHWNEAFEEVCAGRIDVTPMFGRTVDLDGVPQAIEQARDANGPARIIVVP
ncbi:zinc-binding dehydrogenase [Actinomadura rugatobispora]|uniref:Zinc-binding dehydrogenase n=1 Tax=Actinomadura rugatobispora TaxID=1994 RepID=A0ABW0ZQZ0_9ACTN|nr:zinc-binding dehydrogenase [Actinomadura rugatobispora]